MCGILGAWGDVEAEKFRKGLDRIVHRGPDGEGIFKNESDQILFGHRRLSILDLSDCGKQPLHYKHLTITYNGEIYNFPELRKTLEQDGFIFISQSDTEVILASYLKWGVKCLEKFNGMWAFAIWDNREKTLFISRDRFGKKPFFYSFLDDAFVFGSEMKSLTAFLSEIKPSADFSWCINNIMQYEATDKCLIEGIKRFPAGSYAFLKRNDKILKPVKFWDTKENLHKPRKNYIQQVEEFREIFIDACAIRMRSDVPVGTALSGGLDSSAVICTMKHISETRVDDRRSQSWQHAFVACFKGTPLDERHYAEKVINHIKIPATYVEIDPAKGIIDLEKYLYLFEEVYLTSPVPMMEIYSAIKQNGVTVSIDGHGADELMAGYRQDVTSALLDSGLNLQKSKEVLQAYSGLFDKNNSQESIPGTGIKEWLKQLSYHLKGRKNLAKFLLKNVLKDNSETTFGAFDSILYELFHKTVLPTLLRNYDRYSMANSVEIRMPFMDHRLVTYAFSLPWTSKIRKGFTKSLIRDAVRPYMPQEIVNRRSKIGFNTPIVDWLKGPWKQYIMDTLASTNFNNSVLTDHINIKNKITNFMKNPQPSLGEGEGIWNSLTPFFWEQFFLKKQ